VVKQTHPANLEFYHQSYRGHMGGEREQQTA
jgi:hypothetical protein